MKKLLFGLSALILAASSAQAEEIDLLCRVGTSGEKRLYINTDRKYVKDDNDEYQAGMGTNYVEVTESEITFGYINGHGKKTESTLNRYTGELTRWEEGTCCPDTFTRPCEPRKRRF